VIPTSKFKLTRTSGATLDRQMHRAEHRAEKCIRLTQRMEELGREFFGLVPRPDASEIQNMLDAFHFPERQSLEPRDVAEAEARRVYDNIQDDAARERSE